MATSPAGSEIQPLDSATLDDAEAFALEYAVTPHMRDILAHGFAGLRLDATRFELLSFVHLPLLLFATLTGDAAPAHPLAVTTTLIALGAGALDDVADGEQGPEWRGAPDNQIELAAVASLSVLPHLALARIPMTEARAIAMHETLASGLLTMIEGQLADISTTGSRSPDPDAVMASVEAKSGGELAMFTRLTALLAGVDRAAVEACEQMGRAMGVAGQIGADCFDIFQSDHSDDLTNGTRTLPVALHLHTLASHDRARFLRLLDHARRDRDAQLAVRSDLLAAGMVRQCALITGIWVQRAHRHLSEVARFDPPAQELHDWIERSAFRAQETPVGQR